MFQLFSLRLCLCVCLCNCPCLFICVPCHFWLAIIVSFQKIYRFEGLWSSKLKKSISELTLMVCWFPNSLHGPPYDQTKTSSSWLICAFRATSWWSCVLGQYRTVMVGTCQCWVSMFRFWVKGHWYLYILKTWRSGQVLPIPNWLTDRLLKLVLLSSFLVGGEVS